jgi:hypothetical protein
MRIRDFLIVPALSFAMACSNDDFKGVNENVNSSKKKAAEQSGSSNQVPGSNSSGNSSFNPYESPTSTMNVPSPGTGGQNSQREENTNHSNGGSNILPWIIGGVATIGAVVAIGALAGGSGCNDSEITATTSDDPENPQHLSPFLLADTAYRGGICWGGYDRFCTALHGPSGGTGNFIECAIRVGKVNRSLATCEYRNSVDMHLRSTCGR